MGEVLGPVLELCDRATLRSDRVLTAAVDEVRARVKEPLRVGMVGRVNAGKSTLVNALIGQRVASTGPTESTRVVTWFRSGTYDRIEVVTSDGTRVPRRLSHGAVPEDLGVPASEIDHVEVQLSCEELTNLVLVDTPGLGSVNTEVSERGASVLDGGASERVDAVVFAFDSDTVVGIDQQEILAEFGRFSNGRTALNAIAVLSKADVAGDGTDPWPAAERLCEDIGAALPGVFAAVVPVVGLIAETIGAGLFTEADAENLELLAKLEPGTRRLMLMSPDRFTTMDLPVPPDRRHRLVDRLGLHGIATCLEAIDGGLRGAAGLSGLLRTRSRIGAVQDAVRTTFVRHADVVKAANVLDQLEALSYDQRIDRGTRLWLADEVESLRLDPRMHVFGELEAVATVARGEVELPTELAAGLRRLVEGGDDRARVGAGSGIEAQEAVRVAKQLALRYRTFAFHSSPAAARVASVAERSCLLVANRLAKEVR
jgi:energy-coupling factor transporter ATP-binding protein EcfA2